MLTDETANVLPLVHCGSHFFEKFGVWAERRQRRRRGLGIETDEETRLLVGNSHLPSLPRVLWEIWLWWEPARLSPKPKALFCPSASRVVDKASDYLQQRFLRLSLIPTITWEICLPVYQGQYWKFSCDSLRSGGTAQNPSLPHLSMTRKAFDLIKGCRSNFGRSDSLKS